MRFTHSAVLVIDVVNAFMYRSGVGNSGRCSDGACVGSPASVCRTRLHQKVSVVTQLGQGRSWPGGPGVRTPPPEVARTTFVNHANSMRKFSCTPPTPTAPHEIWSVDSQENL